MTKADLVQHVVDSTGVDIAKKDVARIADALFAAMKETLASEGRIEIRGFGSFTVRERKPRLARNPRTGEAVRVQARAVPYFKPSKDLSASVAKRR